MTSSPFDRSVVPCRLWPLLVCLALLPAIFRILWTGWDVRFSNANTQQPDFAARAHLSAAYGKLPLSFEVNQGQTDSQVDFLSRGNGYSLFLTPTEAVFQFWIADFRLQNKTSAVLADGLPEFFGINKLKSLTSQFAGNPKPQSVDWKSLQLRMKVVNGNVKPKVKTLGRLPGKSNYLIGDNPRKWRTDIPRFEKVTYEDVYSGIDLIYYGNQQQLEYDFVVAPGGDPGVIRLRLDGGIGEQRESLRIDTNGDLVAETVVGEIRFRKPIAYQQGKSGRREISASYLLKDQR